MSNQPSTTLQEQTSQVTLVIPCLAEYVGVARLAILGVANRISFTYDEVEDVRLAVAEACTHAVERASEYRKYLVERGDPTPPDSSLTITCVVQESRLQVTVSDTIPVVDQAGPSDNLGLDGIDYEKLGTILMEILVDKVSFDSSSSGTTVRLVKSASQAG